MRSNMNNETMGNVTLNVAAKVKKMDSQTVRLLIQQNLVPWGICFKRKGSHKFTYLIYAKQFEELTGYKYTGESEDK